MRRPVYITDIATLNAAGCEVRDLLDATTAPQPLAFDPSQMGFCVPAPRLPADIFDRKLQRSTEQQGLRLLYCAARLAPALHALNLRAERIAVTAAIPEVDAPSPCWSAVEAIEREPARLLPHLLANTPPLQALALLNSTVIAHVAEGLQCTGPMAGYSSQENSGFDALIEAFWLIAENRADAGLVVSSSPNITPALNLREQCLREELGEESPRNGAQSCIHGEGAAALIVAAEPANAGAAMARIVGHARGYCPPGRNAAGVVERVLQRALAAEKLSLSDIGLAFGDADDALLTRIAAPMGGLQSCRSTTGYLGASALFTDIAFALNRSPLPPYVLLINRNPAGYCHALVLAPSLRETQA